MEMGFYFYTACCFLVIFSKASTAIDTLSQSDSLTDGMTLVSGDGSFQLGFFSPGSSKNRYLGIWYNNIPMQTVVWVANRVNPINDSTGLLKIQSNGKIMLLVQNTTAVWCANSTARVENPVLQLLDSGNLVVRDGKDSEPENYLWQSFDYPSDTMLPGMKIGIDLRTGLHRRLAAWKNWDDPSPGDLTYGVELEGTPEMVLRKGSEKFYRSGLWNGDGFSGTPNLRSNPIFDYDFVWNENEVYYIYSLKNKSVMSRFVLNQTQSVRQRYTWNPETQTWKLFSIMPSDLCDRSGLCGPNGDCDNNKLPACQCLTGFRPKWLERWNSSDWSDGCIHSKPLNCKSGDGFIRIAKVKTPDTTNSWVNKTMNLKECRAKCLRNCSCMAYTNLYVTRGGSGCAMWYGDLLDIKQFQSDGQDLYIRVSASEAERKKKAKVKLAIILGTVIAALLGFLLIVCYILRSRRKLKDEVKDKNLNDREDKDENEDMELAVFEFGTIAQATDSFSFNNKLGQGGFGPVYKGTLGNGQEIAVKRLSKSSGQGLHEFKNEVKLIAKLQHRNLVRLLGCCIHEDERMLVYEYMPNRSLDSFIFDQTRRRVLTWSKRFRIICGIARGLLYLHQDSRLRIIHRDLKTSNVLLDSEMNPKISDFGLARTFGGDQTEANTNRVVGTYGYMAPEYAIDGLFSVKSDVFSFGILLLEIISGRKNRGFYHVNQSGNLIEHAWRLWKESKPLDLADDFLADTGDLSELLRCIHVSLLCIQQHPEERPNMSSVVLMLGSHNELPSPKQPGFLFYKNPFEADCSSGNDRLSSRNEIIPLEAWGKIRSSKSHRVLVVARASGNTFAGGMVRDLGYKKVRIQTDKLEVVRALSMEETVDSGITLLRRVKRFLHSEGQWEIKYVPRECNLIADQLAMISLSWQTSLQIFEVPHDLVVTAIQQDKAFRAS
ncbi:hypothetical protein GOBAR_AA34799 [Gossypium barbadense]|uniref:non-specific serine/threonine protein kinase n=1 Tax=Gossypium barbadense TaxID=3634 RepID=A0A2P5W461_GOSBA|nr:hypothetical protein GOBAR_AA34799 [Gossypium barbadense]